MKMLPIVKTMRIAIADSSSSSATIGDQLSRPIEIVEMVGLVSKTEATALVLRLDKRVLAGSDTGAVTGLATLTFPASNKQGKGLVCASLPSDAAPVEFDANDQIKISVVTASTADKGVVIELRYIEKTDLALNCTDMVASAT